MSPHGPPGVAEQALRNTVLDVKSSTYWVRRQQPPRAHDVLVGQERWDALGQVRRSFTCQ